MPKIKTIKKWIQSGDSRSQTEYEIHYSTVHGFFGSVPKNYFEQAEMLSDEDKKTFSINIEYERKYSVSPIKSIRVKCSSEKECETKMDNLLKGLYDQKKTERNVIIVHFESEKKEFNYDNDFNKEHPQLKMSFGLKYCNEVKIDGGKSLFFESNNPNRKVDLRRGFVVVDDTPENRTMLETAYERLRELSIKLNEVLTSEDKILQLVANGQLLLK